LFSGKTPNFLYPIACGRQQLRYKDNLNLAFHSRAKSSPAYESKFLSPFWVDSISFLCASCPVSSSFIIHSDDIQTIVKVFRVYLTFLRANPTVFHSYLDSLIAPFVIKQFMLI
jgi:hypothetical protein